MDASEMHERAQAVFADVLAQVTDDDLATPTPCVDWTVTDLIDHVVEGNQGTAQHMGGSGTELPTGDRVTAFRTAADRANAGVAL